MDNVIITNGYGEICKTAKYGMVICHGTYRVENRNGLYKKEIPYCEIPKALAEELFDILINYKSYDMSKSGGIVMFNGECDAMIENEYEEAS